jgi:CubicO group peptidase (beta-lactamase class C family)
MEEHLPFWEMEPEDALVQGAASIDVGMGGGKTSRLGPQVLARAGEVYAIYLPTASRSGTIRLAGSGSPYVKRWYNPRAGRFEGAEETVSVGNSAVSIGAPPGDPAADWVVLYRAARSSTKRSGAMPRVFPGRSWQKIDPAKLALDGARLDALAGRLAGRGCVVKHGYVVKSWGPQDEISDWYSSAKPVLSTLLMFAVKERKVSGFDARLAGFGWQLEPKDRSMTLRHLANMTSGYARPDPPGAAWAYNDFAIQLYQKTLFDRIFRDDPAEAANAPDRLGALGLEDGLRFRKKNRRLSASVRDFARIAWFWLNRGTWGEKQLLPRQYFDENMRPQVPIELPHTQAAETDDYLEIGSFGGGSDHFTRYGAGIYGFNWWFNGPGRLHPDSRTWPDAPPDIVLSIGFGGNCAALLPTHDAVLVAARANWGKLEAGRSQSEMNRVLGQFAEAVTPER